MPAVLRTLMKDLLMPYMNVHTLIATYFDHNMASRRVFEKCGFKFSNFVPDAIALSEAKTGVKDKKVGLGVMKWERETST